MSQATTESAAVTEIFEQPQYETVVIGAGLGGICAGIKLQEIGVQNFLIVDRVGGMGGTWYTHHYPDAGCDIPSTTYQFSFARKPDWDRFFAKRDQILEYLEDLATEHGLPAKMRFNTNVVKEMWDDDRHLWRLHVDTGETITARFVISAVGAYINPKTRPDIAGLDSFEGQRIYPADWNHDYDFAGKRVAIIGVGATTMQIAPQLAPKAAQLDLYQRTTQLYMPKPDFVLRPWMQRFLAMPGGSFVVNLLAQAIIDGLLRIAVYTPAPVWRRAAVGVDYLGHKLYRGWLRINVKDPETRKKLTPNFGVVCVRGGLAGSYLTNLNRDNVDLITTPIEEITPDGIRTADGTERKIDALVLATGYEVFSDPESYRPGTVIGRNGFDLGHSYNTDGMKAYYSTSVSGVPNRFIMVGPYSWTGTAFHYFVENAMRHISTVIAETRRRGATVAEVRPEAQDRFHEDMLRSGRNLSFYLGNRCAGSNTYFVNSQGESPYIRPWPLLKTYRKATRFDRDDYEYRTVASSAGERAVPQLPEEVSIPS
ncbi:MULTISPECIES: NAD(P)/FAD-dependent oxidoreductase [unclassified Mycobacterium]|uniref:flavin-containing monooxygenase n=1 Tax=unclassified Mycobacterium TaxID=2642494 RepID=UPI0007400755|nr:MULTISPECIES: NAD(P)/FAD-dependent oxidoreductase [unclassified Mycobacterium]KUH82381.1 monooxygenase [Mycobacterium sp. GA-0227b]KUH88945.1 monooxygenase [Mycobacterium sp. GA-1999]